MKQAPGVARRSVELDFLRGIAILLVMGAHFLFPVTGFAPLDWIGGTLHQVGGVGVNLFFTLSGFLVGGLLLREYKSTRTIRPWTFLARRAFKIWPPFYFLILFHAFAGRHDRSTFLWQNLLQVQNYFGTSIKQTWSLAVEEHFYIFLSFLLFILIGRSARFIISTLSVLCLITIAIRITAVSLGDLDAAFRQTQFRMDSLLYGVILAAISIFYPNQFATLARKRVLLSLSFIALCVFIYVTDDKPVVDRDLGYAVQGIGFSLLLVLVYRNSGILAQQLWYRAVAQIGVYSYGIYLWHTLALEPGRRLIDMMTLRAMPPVIIWFSVIALQSAIALILGIATTRLVEWPALRLRELLLGSDRFLLKDKRRAAATGVDH
jgi:peptidoglycan/LPS O-acetylase OafA/YrhL